PRCACPNPHLSKTKNLIFRQENEKDEITKSILCIVIFLGLTWAIHKWLHLPWIGSAWISAMLSCIFVALEGGVFITLLILLGITLFLGKYLPPSLEPLSLWISILIPFYYMLIRPFIKIYRIRQNEQEIIRTHTNTNPNTSESYAHSETEDAIDVEYTERNEEKEYENK
ncbi:MAG: hypothetical protein Q4A76_05230, partial [Porphyromonadaceae bacterium]|nr:hypothetical protein [Porphyromonadaceae bacterium]